MQNLVILKVPNLEKDFAYGNAPAFQCTTTVTFYAQINFFLENALW
jgi:hypothetical protein